MKNKKNIIVTIIVVLLVVVGIGTILYISKNNKESLDSNNSYEVVESEKMFTSSEFLDLLEESDIDADTYYSQNAEVMSVTDVEESKEVLTEKNVTEFLIKRGFQDYPITTEYSIDGEFFDDEEIDESSSQKHPLYEMQYVSSNDILWIIYIVNGSISAYPVTYNLESERNAPLLITESDTVISYDYPTNRFYETIPKESAVIVKKIDKINYASLDSFTIGDLSKL